MKRKIREPHQYENYLPHRTRCMPVRLGPLIGRSAAGTRGQTPSLHVHSYPPSLLTQFVLAGQSWVLSVHSLMSIHIPLLKEAELKPFLHVQENVPTRLLQLALAPQGKLISHSLTSVHPIVEPSPVNPWLHVHKKEPTKFWQVELGLHVVLLMHSLMS